MSAAPERVAHWLRPNAGDRMPRRVVTLDSEAFTAFDGKAQTQTFRCAVAALDVLDVDATPIAETEWVDAATPGELWGWVDRRTSTSHRTVCFAHRVDYDIRVTEALTHLPALGWEVKQFGLSGYGAWVFLRRSGRSLYLVDSHSHLPVPLDRLAGMLNRRRPRLPADDAPMADWLRRCRADVRVLREAILETLRLYRLNECGDFRTSGAGQASACFRHRFLQPKSLLVHDDMDALKAERRAVYAGRAEVWRHGRIAGPLYEYDYDAAYARIALENELPMRLEGEFYPRTWPMLDRCRESYAVLADVTVYTDAPTVPTEYRGRIVWPVGSFRSTLWDVELELAREHGARLELHRYWCYQRGPLLKSWAEWILAGLAGGELGATPIGRLIVKEWSRALIGRFGLRYPLLERQGPMPFTDLSLYPVEDGIEGRDTTYLQVGSTLYEQTERVESPSSTPFVLGFIMAVARVKLWRAMLAAGLDNVLSVDTDGLIVGEVGAARLDAVADQGRLAGLRRKAEYSRAELRGPRNIDLGDTRRVSGVPRKAERLAPGVYRGEVWESLPAALRRRRTSSVVVYERRFNVADADPRRLHLPDGSTSALLLTLPDGTVAAADAVRAAVPLRAPATV